MSVLDLLFPSRHYAQRIGELELINRRLQAEIDRKSQMPGDHRYWEGRYRDEAAENDTLRAHAAVDEKTIAELQEELSIAENEAARWKQEAGANHRARLDAVRERDLAGLQVHAYRDAVELFADRAGATPEELAQLNLGTLIPGRDGKPDSFVFGDLEDAKSSIDFAMKNQATVAKFRQLKEHFVKHQQAVTILLDKIEAVTRKNRITAEDHNALRGLRDTLSQLIRRSI